MAWSNEEILRLYKWKIVKKKGNNTIVKDFPGETEASLTAAWKAHKREGEGLYHLERARRRGERRGG